MKNQILDFGASGAVKASSIQFMSRFLESNVTHIGFVDGTEDDFLVKPEKAFPMWFGVQPSIFIFVGAAFDPSRIAAIQLFASGHEDSPFEKNEAVIRIWFEHGELFLPSVCDMDALFRRLIDAWKAVNA